MDTYKRREQTDWKNSYTTLAQEMKTELSQRKFSRRPTKEKLEFIEKGIKVAGLMAHRKLTHLPVPKHESWESHWGSSSMCSYCENPAISDTIMCNKCNSITHTECVIREQVLGNQYAIKSAKNEYTCVVCLQSIEKDMNDYKKDQVRALFYCSVVCSVDCSADCSVDCSVE